jgi:hypothetical protein
MKNTKLVIGTMFLSVVLGSCTNQTTSTNDEKEIGSTNETAEKATVVYDTNDPATMINAVAEACGGIEKLRSLKDVSYNYNYLKPDGKRDYSTEKYIFDSEASWASYTTHEVNVAPDLEGEVIQFYDGKTIVVTNNGEKVTDEKIVGTGQFLRQANFMWFTMMFKLTDPGTIYEYKGKKEVEGTTYDLVRVTYDSAVTGKAENDIFILFINPETHMVERFNFSLPALGVLEPVLLAITHYEEVDGIQVIRRREMFAPNPETGEMMPALDQTLTNITFNNNLTIEGLRSSI